jgi:hypothetical protein
MEEAAQVVKLTVVHNGFEPGSSLAEMVSSGWPNVVASLKSLLETGEPLPDDWSPPDRFIARRWASFVGPLRAK